MTVAIQTATDFATARRAMIDSQLRTSGVNEPWVLARMNAVPREDFVPEGVRGAAYIDRAVPLGGGAMLAAPLFHARMLAEAKPSLSDRVLVIDGGSGYLPALLEGIVGAISVMTADEATNGRGGD
ncbi:MAG: protein-L-isoaspartate O-methyltransferase, partial [Croceibacterium sp.]